MSARKKAETRKSSGAKSGAGVRERMRELSVRAFKDGNLSMSDLPELIHDMLEDVIEGVDQSIPKARGSVLREVFEGLSEGVHAIASAGGAAVSGVRERGKKVAGANIPDAAHRIRAANEEFLGAVRMFAQQTSKDVREELDELVDRAEKAGPKVTASARRSVKAADGRMSQLSEEAARAGMQVVRRAVGGIAMGAGGFLEGIAEAVTPKRQPPAAGRSSSRKAGVKKTAPKKTAKKKTVAKKSAKRASGASTTRKKSR